MESKISTPVVLDFTEKLKQGNRYFSFGLTGTFLNWRQPILAALVLLAGQGSPIPCTLGGLDGIV